MVLVSEVRGGGNTLGAAFFDACHDRTYLVDPAGTRSTNTVTRAELGAISCAITHAVDRPTLTLFTDSQVSIHLIQRHAYAPRTLLECKHNHLLADITDALFSRASRGLRTSILKVKAHSGVRGNEAADRGAARSAGGVACHYSVTAPNESVLTLPAWPVASDPPATAGAPPSLDEAGLPYVLSNLTTAVTAAVDPFEHACGLAKPTYYTALRAVLAAQSSPDASNHMWAVPIPFAALRLALQMRYNDLWCSSRAHRCSVPYPSSGPFPSAGGACPLCGCCPASVGHIFGACTHPAMKPRYIARHNKAVCMIHAAVSVGLKGSMLCVAMDACPRADLPAGVLGTRLPRWLLPRSCLPTIACPVTQLPLPPSAVRRKLRPDLLFVDGLAPEDVRGGKVPRSTRARCTVHVIEVGYVSESSHHYIAHSKRKLAQHARLCAALTSAGWVVSGGGPTVMLLGQAGTIFGCCEASLLGLGVVGYPCVALMRALHLHSLACALAINTTRLSLESGRAA